jgi:peptidoglycan/LPS O-acetylase OafA/YrhL
LNTDLQLNRDRNNFGFLRLLFASLVILSHSPQLIDGNMSREILHRIFGTIDFGGVSVDGFFLISGYLITASYVRSRTKGEYLLKRALRIYPGFWVACGVSYIIAYLYGGHFFTHVVPTIEAISNLILLNTPSSGGAFQRLPHHGVNGSLWTIAYEFRCYLLVMLLGSLGMLRNRRIYLSLTCLCLIIAASGFNIPYPGHISLIVGNLHADFLLGSMFLCGGVFFLYRDKIAYKSWLAAIFALAMMPLLFFPLTAEVALATLGAYVLFSFAFHSKAGFLSRVDNKVDLSYGIYLYAWPIQQMIIWQDREISPWLLTVITLVLASSLAYLSWTLVERPCMRLKKRFLVRGANNLPQPEAAL